MLLALVFVLPSVGFASWFIIAQNEEYAPIPVDQSEEKAVAYLKGAPNVFYTSIHRAVEVATTATNKNIYIIPGSTFSIDQPLVIPSGVSLYVPYAAEKYENVANDGNFAVTALADTNAANVTKNRKTLINLNSTITVESGGYLYLGGEFSPYGIIGSYCEINLSSLNSQIIVNGTFYCYGYLKEANITGTDNRRLVINDGAVGVGVFAFYQTFGSLSIPKGLVENNVLPLSRFDFPNLQTEVFLHYGGKSRAKCHIMLASPASPFNEEVNVVGPQVANAKEMFYMAAGGATNYIKMTYTPKSKLYTSSSATAALTTIDLYSNVSLGYLELDLGLAVSTANMAIPFSHRIHIAIKSGGSFNINYKVKFLGGSKLTVDHGGTLNVNSSLLIYDEAATSLVYSYPTGQGEATLINNGTINVDPAKGFIGGKIHTTNQNGTALINLQNIIHEKNLYASVPEGRKAQLVTLFFQGYAQTAADPEKKLVNFIRATTISSSMQYEDCWDETKTIGTKKIDIEIQENDFQNTVFSYDLSIDFNDGSTDKILVADNSIIASDFEINESYSFDITVKRTSISTIQASNSSGPFNYANGNYPMAAGDYLFSIMPSEAVIINIGSSNSREKPVQQADGTYKWSGFGPSGNGTFQHSISESIDGGTFVQISKPANWPGDIFVVKGSKFFITFSSSTHKVTYESAFLDYYAKKGDSVLVGSSAPIADLTKPLTSPARNSGDKYPKNAATAAQYTAGKHTLSDGTIVDYNYARWMSENGKISTCVTADTLITMADGSYKQAGDVHAGDMLKVFNHETGQLDVSPVVFNDDYDSEAEEHDVIYLEFSNGKSVKVVAEHGFFDKTTMRYEYIDLANYQNFIGHRFASISEDVVGETTLINAYVKTEVVKVVSPVTAFHLNIITNDMLSMPGGVYGLFNMFEFDPNLQYNEAMKAADIAKYGLFTYEDFEDLVPYEFYAAFPAPYLKVAIGKGMITWEDVVEMINRYLEVANSQN